MKNKVDKYLASLLVLMKDVFDKFGIRKVLKYTFTDRFGDELAQWLLDNKIVEHIFGPNLHVEVTCETMFN